MSLIGSELDCSEATPEISKLEVGVPSLEMSSPSEDLEDDGHGTVTPPGPAENLLVDMETTVISASLLASHMHLMSRTSSSRTSNNTTATDDFHTAAESVDTDDDAFMIDNTSPDHPFQSEIFQFSRSPIPEEPSTTMSTIATPTKTTPTENVADPAEKVYETAKSVWAWGKGIFFISPFLGASEAVAGKVAEMAGSNLTEVDGALKGHLHGLDEGILNPAIAKLVEAILAATGKTEEFLKPIVVLALKPLGMIKGTSDPEPELTA